MAKHKKGKRKIRKKPAKLILRLMRGGAVGRWHTRKHLFPEDNAAHMWGVAIIALYLCERYERSRKKRKLPRIDLMSILIWCLHHDIPEEFTGDTPSPMKAAYPKIRTIYGKANRKYWRKVYGVRKGKVGAPSIFLREEESWIVSLADSLHALIYCNREISGGNKAFQKKGKSLRKGLGKKPMGWLAEDFLATYAI